MQHYTTIVGVIELRLKKQSYDTIQKRYSIGSSTVTLIMKRFKEMGLSLDDLKQMEPGKVEKAFYPPENLAHSNIPMPDYQKIYARMIAMGKNADLSYIWLDYKKENPDGYQLTQFYQHYNEFVREHYGAEQASMPVERIPGEKMFIDWVGDEPELLTNPETGEITKVHIFTTTLGFSSCVYAEAFLDEKTPSFVAGTVNALEFYGAVPKYLVPDNLKASVKKHSKDELILQTAYSDLEDFYDTIVLPPPARRPKGKATVERHVKFLEVHLIEKLKENIYTSLPDLNRRIREIVAAINQRRFQRKTDIRFTRMDAFEKYDKPRMNQLPGGKYTLCDYKSFSRVPDNYHLEYDGHYYSVLYTYLGKPAILKATMTEIRICDANNRLICTHPRSYKRFPIYITDDSHMPADHQYYKELNGRDGAYYRRWASAFGKNMESLIDRVLRSAKHEEQAYNSCMGILQYSKDSSRTLVDDAAETCLRLNTCNYSSFKRILNDLRDHKNTARPEPGHLPNHSNIRGKEAFK